ncbi:hypothetical protein CBR_g48665 [Chara braunii]|uniref:CHAT domain-containing protein n=1 Tax=Chara braunii TaxID=69332 RepID=A0A388K4E8_CHABU|nr:hypothetical protein CBR_g48665 [Chara braunii]|eukprot:GBG64917.1 hypothetical protein CBR_g48665 [Chara braunii]
MAEDSIQSLWRNISSHFRGHGGQIVEHVSSILSPRPSSRANSSPNPSHMRTPSRRPSPSPRPLCTYGSEESKRSIQIEKPLDFMDVAQEVRFHISKGGEAGMSSAVELVERAFQTWRWMTDRPSTIAFFLAELWRGVFVPKPWEELPVFTLSTLKEILRPASSFNEIETLFCLAFMERYTNPFQPSGRLNVLCNLLRATKEGSNKVDDVYAPIKAVALMDIQFLLDQVDHNLQGIDKDMLLESYGKPPVPLKSALNIWKQLSYLLSANMTEKSSTSKPFFCLSMQLSCEHELVMFNLWRESAELAPCFQEIKERIALTRMLGLVEEELLSYHDQACFTGLVVVNFSGRCSAITESTFKELVHQLLRRGYKRWAVDVLEDLQGVRDLGKPAYFSSSSFVDCGMRLKFAMELALANKECLRDQIRCIYSICDLGRVLWVLQNEKQSKELLDKAIRLYMDIEDTFGSPLMNYPLEVTGLEWARCKEALGALSSVHDITWSRMFYAQAKEVYEVLHMLTPDREVSLLLCNASLCLGLPSSSGWCDSNTAQLEKLLAKVDEKMKVMMPQWLRGGGVLMTGRYNLSKYSSLDLKGHLHVDKEEFAEALECMEQYAASTNTHLSLFNVTTLCGKLGDEQAAAKWRKVALIKFKEEQRAIGELSLEWERFYGESDASEFLQVQMDRIRDGDPLTALIWSEWSHHRFLSAVLMNRMRNGADDVTGFELDKPGTVTHAASIVGPDKADTAACNNANSEKRSPFECFDSDEANAKKSILEGCDLCGPRSLVVEYHFHGGDFEHERVVIYVMNARNIFAHAIPYAKLEGVQVHVEELNDLIKLDHLVPESTPPSLQKSELHRSRSSQLPEKKHCTRSRSCCRSTQGLQSRMGISPARRRRMMNAVLEKLYELLIVPIEQQIESLSPEDKLIIVPHDILWSVPFAMLRDGKRRASEKPYLVERHTVAVVPGIHLLPTLKKRSDDLINMFSAAEGSTGQKSLVVGDPFPLDFNADPLPYAGKEALKVYEILTPGTARLLTGRDATKQQVLSALQCGAPIAHFAAHVLVGSRAELKIDADFEEGAMLLSHDPCGESASNVEIIAAKNDDRPCMTSTTPTATIGLSSSDKNAEVRAVNSIDGKTGVVPVNELCAPDQQRAAVQSAIRETEGPAICCDRLQAEAAPNPLQVDLVDKAAGMEGLQVPKQRSSHESSGDSNAAADGSAEQGTHLQTQQAEEARMPCFVDGIDVGAHFTQEVGPTNCAAEQQPTDDNVKIASTGMSDVCPDALQTRETLNSSEIACQMQTEESMDPKVTRIDGPQACSAALETSKIRKSQEGVEAGRAATAAEHSSADRGPIDEAKGVQPQLGISLEALHPEEISKSFAIADVDVSAGKGAEAGEGAEAELSSLDMQPIDGVDVTELEMGVRLEALHPQETSTLSVANDIDVGAVKRRMPEYRPGCHSDNVSVDATTMQRAPGSANNDVDLHTDAHKLPDWRTAMPNVSAEVPASQVPLSNSLPHKAVKRQVPIVPAHPQDNAESMKTETPASSMCEQRPAGSPPQAASWATPTTAAEFPGALKAEEILEVFGNDLKSLLVVLSCCNSAKGLLRPEGVLSYARAFLISQVPCLVPSLWEIDDEATFTLMLAFYRALAKGHDVSASLRLAMLKMISARHPSTSNTELGSRSVAFPERAKGSERDNDEQGTLNKECEEVVLHAYGIPVEDLEKEMKALSRRMMCKPGHGGCARCRNDNMGGEGAMGCADAPETSRGAQLSWFVMCADEEGEDDEDENDTLIWQPNDWGGFLCLGLPTLTLPGGLFSASE